MCRHHGVIHNSVIHSNEGDLSPHTSHMVYFSNTNENRSSARESLYEVDIVIESMYLASKGAIYVKLQHLSSWLAVTMIVT